MQNATNPVDHNAYTECTMVLDKVLSAPLRAKRKGDDVDFEGFPNHGADESDRDEGDNMSDGFDEEGGSVGSLEDEDEVSC